LNNFRSDKESSVLQKQRQHHKISAVGEGGYLKTYKINGVDIQMTRSFVVHITFLSIHQQWEHDHGQQIQIQQSVAKLNWNKKGRDEDGHETRTGEQRHDHKQTQWTLEKDTFSKTLRNDRYPHTTMERE